MLLLLGPSIVGANEGAWVVEGSSLADVVRLFSERHHVCVTYEDPILVYTGDFEDVSDRYYTSANLAKPADLAPLYATRKINYRAEYDLPPAHFENSDITETLRAIVESYNRSGGYPGRFKVLAEPPCWHIIPTEIRNNLGDWVPAEPFLSRAISVHPQSTNLYRLVLSLLRSEASAAGQSGFGFGSNPIGPVPTTSGPLVNIVGGEIDLRSFLIQVFGGNFTGLVWQLRCGPTVSPGSVPLSLNLFQIGSSMRSARDIQKSVAESHESVLRPVTGPNDPPIYRMSFNGPRPLRDAVEAFMTTHRVIVTYEDPLIVYSNDLDDKTYFRKDLSSFPPGEAPRVLDPKTHALNAEYWLDTNNLNRSEVGVALHEIVRQYNAGQRTAEFGLVEYPDSWHVVPRRIKNSDGEWITADSLLDATVHVDGGKTNAQAFIAELIKERSRAAGHKCWTFTAIPPQMITVVRGDYALHDLLSRIITDTFDNLSWFLLYDPSEPPAGGWALNYFWIPQDFPGRQ